MQSFVGIGILLALLLLLCVKAEVDIIGRLNGTRSSRWLNQTINPRAQIGCWNRPWICNQGVEGQTKPPLPFRRRRCCRNRCVDVSSDIFNCGFCGIRCPFTWQCCNGLCVNTNVNPFNCGRCGNQCPLGSLCFYGMCGYAVPPIRPKPPHPPFPPKPPKPFPPKPPKPFPPKPPKPFPPAA